MNRIIQLSYIRRAFFIWLLLISFFVVSAQNQYTEIQKRDTLLMQPTFGEKMVVFRYNEVDFILDYERVRKFTITLTEKEHMQQTAKNILRRLEQEIKTGDTAHLDLAYFLSINWVPYSYFFLCEEIDKKACLIRDVKGVIHYTIIAEQAIFRIEQYSLWGGILYRLPDQKSPFFTKTNWIS